MTKKHTSILFKPLLFSITIKDSRTYIPTNALQEDRGVSVLLTVSLTHSSRCSINVCWMNECTNLCSNAMSNLSLSDSTCLKKSDYTYFYLCGLDFAFHLVIKCIQISWPVSKKMMHLKTTTNIQNLLAPEVLNLKK